jgi:hypothetical protein
VCFIVVPKYIAATYESDDETYDCSSGYAVKNRGIHLNILPTSPNCMPAYTNKIFQTTEPAKV